MLVRRIFAGLIFLVVAIFGIGFAMLNTEPVQINFYFATWEPARAMALGVFLLIGVALGLAFSWATILRLKRRIAHLQRAREAEKPAVRPEDVRSVPIKVSPV